VKDDRIAETARNHDRPDAPASEPPRIYCLACGAQCDIFWWARRKAVAADSPDADRRAPDRD
jgi:hypothetical protein